MSLIDNLKIVDMPLMSESGQMGGSKKKRGGGEGTLPQGTGTQGNALPQGTGAPPQGTGTQGTALQSGIQQGIGANDNSGRFATGEEQNKPEISICKQLELLNSEANDAQQPALQPAPLAPQPAPQEGGVRRHHYSSDDDTSSSSSFSSESSDSEEDPTDDDNTSVSTTELLGQDPLFLVLSQYFMTSSSRGGKNITEVLDDISCSLKKIVRKLNQISKNI